jgi:hypothetical protein
MTVGISDKELPELWNEPAGSCIDEFPDSIFFEPD